MKRRQTFEEEQKNEKQSRRLSYDSPIDAENRRNIGEANLKNNLWTDYQLLKGRYTSLENRYEAAKTQLDALEQSKYEDDEFVERANNERDKAIKRATDAEVACENAKRKADAMELLNKNLNEDQIKTQKVVEKMKKDYFALEKKLSGVQQELDVEKKKSPETADLKSKYDNLRHDYQIYKETAEKYMSKADKEKEAETKRAEEALTKIQELQTVSTDRGEQLVKVKNELNDIQQQLANERIAKEQQNEKITKCKKLEVQLEEFRNEAKKKDDQIMELNKQLGNVKKELDDEKNDSKRYSSEAKTKTKKLENTIDELRSEAKRKQEKNDEFIKQLDQISKNMAKQQTEANQRITELNAQNEKLEAELSKYHIKSRNSLLLMGTKNDQIMELNKQLSNIKKELDDEKSRFARYSTETKAKTKQLENTVDDLTKDAKSKKEKADELQILLEKITQQMKNQRTADNQRITELTVQIGKLDAELSRYRNDSKKKDQQIGELQKQLDEQKRLVGEKVNEAEANLKKFEEQIAKLESKCDQYRLQLENAKTTATQEREEHTVAYQYIETLNRDLTARNAKITAEKKEAETDFANSQKEWKLKVIELEKSVKDSACKMFNEWKNNYIEKKNASTRNQQRPPKCDRPKWIISESCCNNIYNSSQKRVEVFLRNFTKVLFNSVEELLNEESLDQEKWNEAKAVVCYYWEPADHVQKQKCIEALRHMMRKKRNTARGAAYKDCNSTRCVGFTSDGTKFYYSLRSHNLWKPYSDLECKNILRFKMTQHSTFGIPYDYSSAEYIIILHDSPTEGHMVSKMMLPSGFIESLQKKKTPKAKE
jgi:chromosome segregation ATPase